MVTENKFNQKNFFQEIIEDYRDKEDFKIIREKIKNALNQGFDLNTPIDIPSFYGRSLFQIATTFNDLETMRFLTTQGADIHFKDSKGRSAAHYVRSQKAARFLNERQVDMNAPDQDGLTPLGYKVEYHPNQPSAVKALLENGADPLARDKNGDFAISYMSMTSMTPAKTKETYHLIRKAMDTSLKNYQHFKEFELRYASHPNESTIDLLIQTRKDNFDVQYIHNEYAQPISLLHLATQNGDIRVIESLVKGGVDINTPNRYGKTALHFVQDVETAKKLIQLGADIHQTDRDGFTPFMSHIQEESNPALVKTLLEAGSDLVISDHNEQTALSIAQETAQQSGASGYAAQNLKIIQDELHKREEQQKYEYNFYVYQSLIDHYNHKPKASAIPVLEEALKAGYDINFSMPEYNNASIAHFAALAGHAQDLNFMKEQGADLKQTDSLGMTLLHKTSNPFLVDYLVNEGLDVNARNNDGQTPLVFNVSISGKAKMTQTLIGHDADIHSTDLYHKTARDYATELPDGDLKKNHLSLIDSKQRQLDYAKEKAERERALESARLAEEKLKAAEAQKKADEEATAQIIKRTQQIKQAVSDEIARRENQFQHLSDLEKAGIELNTEEKQLLQTYKEIQNQTALPTQSKPMTEDVPHVPMTIRHCYGETLQDHDKIIQHAQKRNMQRIKSKARETALENLKRLEESGLIAKGPDGTTTSDVRLYQLYQSVQLLSKNDTIQMELDEGIEKVPVSDLLTDEAGRSHKQIYKLLTRQKLSEEELKKMADVFNCLEEIINGKGNVVNESAQHKKHSPMVIMEIEEEPTQNETAFVPEDTEENGESSHVTTTQGTSDTLSRLDNAREENQSMSESNLKNRLSQAETNSGSHSEDDNYLPPIAKTR